MCDTIPGTTLPRTDAVKQGAFEALAPILSVTKGLTLAQIRELTGLESSTVQNWVKRGWVSNPQNKRYTEIHLARILIINILRPSLRLEKIARLMQYVNGTVGDPTDDIIAESELYDYLCAVIIELEETDVVSRELIEKLIGEELVRYKEKVPGAKEKLLKALTVMILACLSGRIKSQADALLKSLIREEVSEID